MMSNRPERRRPSSIRSPSRARTISSTRSMERSRSRTARHPRKNPSLSWRDFNPIRLLYIRRADLPSWEELSRLLLPCIALTALCLTGGLVLVYLMGIAYELAVSAVELTSGAKCFKVAPYIGLEEFCSPAAVPALTEPLLYDEPTGTSVILNWTLARQDLAAARQAMADISSDSDKLVVESESWKDTNHQGKEFHDLALGYALAEKTAGDQVEDHFQNHTSFIDTMHFAAKHLDNRLLRMLDYYAPGSFWLSRQWHWIPGRSNSTPMGWMEQVLITFVKDRRAEVEKLIAQTESMTHLLKATQQIRSQISTTLEQEWDLWKQRCTIEVYTGYIWGRGEKTLKIVRGKDKSCYWDPREFREILKENLSDSFNAAFRYAEVAMGDYQDLRKEYNRIAAELQEGRELRHHETISLESYKLTLASIHDKITGASDALCAR